MKDAKSEKPTILKLILEYNVKLPYFKSWIGGLEARLL
jgi:hypothetical protein